MSINRYIDQQILAQQYNIIIKIIMLNSSGREKVTLNTQVNFTNNILSKIIPTENVLSIGLIYVEFKYKIEARSQYWQHLWVSKGSSQKRARRQDASGVVGTLCLYQSDGTQYVHLPKFKELEHINLVHVTEFKFKKLQGTEVRLESERGAITRKFML